MHYPAISPFGNYWRTIAKSVLLGFGLRAEGRYIRSLARLAPGDLVHFPWIREDPKSLLKSIHASPNIRRKHDLQRVIFESKGRPYTQGAHDSRRLDVEVGLKDLP
jgi:hypothetical protein